eukprot:275491-Pelagomonas_calceolata.AAC.5
MTVVPPHAVLRCKHSLYRAYVQTLFVQSQHVDTLLVQSQHTDTHSSAFKHRACTPAAALPAACSCIAPPPPAHVAAAHRALCSPAQLCAAPSLPCKSRPITSQHWKGSTLDAKYWL